MTEQEWLASEDPVAMLAWITPTPEEGPEGGWHLAGIRKRISDRKLRLWVEACRNSGNVNDYVGNNLESKSNLRVAIEYWANRDGERDVPMSLRAALLRDIVSNPYRPVTLPAGMIFCRRCQGDGWNPSDDGWGARDQCKVCDGKGTLPLGGCPWITPTVITLAQAAYEDLPGRKCGRCDRGTRTVSIGEGEFARIDYQQCPDCHGTGRIEDGILDTFTLVALADALEEAGCAGEKCPECKGSGTYTVQCTNAALSAANGYGASTTYSEWRGCRRCGGDYNRKGVGCIPNPILAHLRSPGPHVRGCWVIDLILGNN